MFDAGRMLLLASSAERFVNATTCLTDRMIRIRISWTRYVEVPKVKLLQSISELAYQQVVRSDFDQMPSIHHQSCLILLQSQIRYHQQTPKTARSLSMTLIVALSQWVLLSEVCS